MTGKEIIMLIRTEPAIGHRKLFDEYKNYIYAIAYNRLRSVASKEDIEECVGDVFADIIIQIQSGDTEINELSAYIGTIAKRKAIKYYHRLANDKTVSEDISTAHGEIESVSKSAEVNERNRAIIRCIKELGEPDSTIIIMKYYYKRSSMEIAHKTGLKPATVRKRIERALDKLGNKLKTTGIIDKEDES